jgi:HK97 family phage major capsid protein
MAITLGTATEMRERREKLIHDADALVVGEDGKPISFKTNEDRQKFDAIMADVDAYRVALEDADRGDKLAAMQRTGLPESQRSAARETADGQPDPAAKALYERALGQYIRGVDMGEMQPEERAALRAGYRTFTKEERDMATTSGAAGGFIVAPDTRFYGSIIQAMKFFGGMEAAGAEVFNTDTAGPLPIPMGDDTGNVGAIVPEALASGHAGGTSPTLSQLVLNGYLYSSKVVKVSWQMLRDGALDVEGYVGGLLGQRLARIQNTHFTASGTGSGQPLALTASLGGVSVGRQSAVGNTASVAFDDIYKTIHSVDVAYRTPECRWMFHDNSALTLRLAKDGQGRYLWPEMGSVQAGQPGVLAGYPFVINNDMAQMAASAKWATFGQHSYYKIRRVKGLTIVRINELYVESGQVGFLAFQSADGGYANPGQNPIKALQNSAT